MCGIGGIFYFRGKVRIDKDFLKDMAKNMDHRGPDGQGFYEDRNIGLCHTRLSIIDLSDKGKQPMANEDGTIWLVFNGEIYNFKELRLILESKGHKFKSDTDSEAIIHAYEEFGADCVNYFEGMFAFAIWNTQKKEMFLARDRVGKKPLFYYKDDDKFIFASELKAILVHESINRGISRAAISHYLSFGYIPAPLSIFKNIKKVLPGYIMSINAKKEFSTKRYWDIKFNEENGSEDYFKEKILKELESAVKKRLISDVPLGVFLSGGIDSSTVVALMAKYSEEPVKTFSIGFEEKSFDETKYARLIAEKFNTDHKEFIVKPDAISILPKLIWHYNEPYADSSALPSYYLAKMTRKYVRVALNGDGGDESFIGYDRYAANNLMGYYQKIPGIFRKVLFNFSKYLPEPMTQKNIFRMGKRFIQTTNLSKEDAYISFLLLFNGEEKKAIFPNEINSSIVLKDELKKVSNLPFINQMSYVDIKRYLPDDLLVKMDIATMANSLETRSPFLDYKLMEFAASIPAHLKLKGLNKKYILKKALYPLLPKSILNRKKMGFGIPQGAWFRNELKSISHDILLSKEVKNRNYLNQETIKKILEQHNSKNRDNGYKIWSLLWLELWHRIYVDNEKVIKPTKDIYSLI